MIEMISKAMQEMMNVHAQHTAMKAKHPDAILLFRDGKYYIALSMDAVDCNKICGTGVSRVMFEDENGSMVFVKYTKFLASSLDMNLPKLVRAGRRVAICEHQENPATEKKLAKRA